MTKKFVIDTIPQLTEACKSILSESKSKIFVLYGDLGSGKTTFVKECCRILGISKSQVSSPSFSIQNSYISNDFTVHHFDLYRIENIHEFYQLGIDEYLDGKSYCFIEWPKFIDEINIHITKVFFKFDTNGRMLEVKYEG